ncbi:hypothetical protein E2C01_063266 [Portunus trituberculatus]|uniref:Uncharacterized protein n=1 Tax=Portunus trituberculatus TaxID=210409 RepID=A0A5B7HFV7_PORTR|nr:hypothetical protein [Portunus trituberculatus]
MSWSYITCIVSHRVQDPSLHVAASQPPTTLKHTVMNDPKPFISVFTNYSHDFHFHCLHKMEFGFVQ